MLYRIIEGPFINCFLQCKKAAEQVTLIVRIETSRNCNKNLIRIRQSGVVLTYHIVYFVWRDFTYVDEGQCSPIKMRENVVHTFIFGCVKVSF